MAKKKVEDFMKAGERYYIIGEVRNAKVEKKESGSGNVYHKYSAMIKMANGVNLFVNKNRFTPVEGKEEPQFVIDRFEFWEELIETDFNTERVFVQVSSKKQKDKPMYNWLTNYEKEDGQISYNIDGFMFRVHHIEDEPVGDDEQGQVVLNFDKTAIAFKETKTSFNATMYVKDIEGQKLYLTDGKENYSNDLLVELPEEMENRAEIGQGYEFRLRIDKGKRHSVSNGVANWGDNSGDVIYNPDKCIVEAVVGVVKDMVLSGVSGRTSSKKKTVEVEDAPF